MKTPYLIIQQKREGQPLSQLDIETFISGYVKDDIPDYQMSALLMAIFFRGMTSEEIAILTKAMMDSGDVIDPLKLAFPNGDKHSTGGVGDKISIILAPLAASAGLNVPMMSGRGLGHTGGTLDKLESIPGFNTQLDHNAFIHQVEKIGVAMVGQTKRMVPADKKMYALRDVTATVDCIPLIAASIMSKKLAAGPKNLVLDVKVGRGAFMKSKETARELATCMINIGQAHQRNVRAILTDMHSQPLGNAIGNSLEIIECVEILRGKGPASIRNLTLILTAEMLVMAGIDNDKASAMDRLNSILDSGKAYTKFLEMVKWQGGNPKSLEPPYRLPIANGTVITAETSGYVSGINPMTIGLTSIKLGAGRIHQDDTIDHGAGFMINVNVGDDISEGDTLVTVFSNHPVNPELKQEILNAFEIQEQPPDVSDIIIDRIPSF